MIAELAIATVMVCLTVFIHGWGLSLLGRIVHVETEDERAERVPWASPRAVGFTMTIVLSLFAFHGVEIWLYAALYQILGAVANLKTAVYFSTITYGAIGYGDESMAESWRLVAAIEGINGILLIGWSTAFFVTVMARFQEIHRSKRRS